MNLGARYSSPIEVSIDGPEEIAVPAKSGLGEVFDGMKPWYSPISRVDFFYFISAIVIFAYTVLNLMVGSGSDEPQSLRPERAVLVAVIVVGAFAGIAALIRFLNRLRARFFPVAVFALGQGHARYDLDDKVRWAVIVGVAVSVVSSLVVAALLA